MSIEMFTHPFCPKYVSVCRCSKEIFKVVFINAKENHTDKLTILENTGKRSMKNKYEFLVTEKSNTCCPPPSLNLFC